MSPHGVELADAVHRQEDHAARLAIGGIQQVEGGDLLAVVGATEKTSLD